MMMNTVLSAARKDFEVATQQCALETDSIASAESRKD